MTATVSSSEVFVQRLLDKYDVPESAVEEIKVTLAAGEADGAAVCALESAPVSSDELAEFEELAKSFDWMDSRMANDVISVVRDRLTAT